MFISVVSANHLLSELTSLEMRVSVRELLNSHKRGPGAQLSCGVQGQWAFCWYSQRSVLPKLIGLPSQVENSSVSLGY